MHSLTPLDYLVFGGYFLVVMTVVWWVSRRGKDSSEDYFLAGRSLPWWIIGASLIASNISTEQIIGMNGTAFESGIAVISYSLIGAAVTILLVARYFLPAFLKMKIYSMPEFLERRYDWRVSTGMGVFWILVYIFVNLTSVLSLGAITLKAVLDIPITYSIVGLAAVSAVYTIYGGLSAVAWTDFIQVGVLIIGGLAVVWLGLDTVADGEGVAAGFSQLYRAQSDKFHTILPASHEELPWTGIFLGGLWIAALSYWGCNQYIIQRALAAQSLQEARYGLLFAAFLSLVVSLIIVVPGVIAAELYPQDITARDQAFPYLVKRLLPPGYTGLVIAALIAAIISSLNAMCNSVATIFTMDIYCKVIHRGASDRRMIRVGRVATAVSLLLAMLVAPSVARLGRLFLFIQEYTGFVTPGVLCIFLFGLFWPRANSRGALAVLLLTVPVSVGFKWLAPDIAFLNRMTLTFLVLVATMVGVSLRSAPTATSLAIDRAYFGERSSVGFNLGALVVIGIAGTIYLVFS